MLWTKLNINIKRNTDEIDENNDYKKLVVYENLEARMIEIKNKEFSTDISQAEAKQQFAFMIAKDKTEIKIWDNITYTDAFWEVKLKITVRPKFIEFEDSENFIKLTAELIWA